MAPDHAALRSGSTFHVKHFLELAYGLEAPVSPHLAARLEGVTIDVAEVVRRACDLRRRADVVVVELPGGLFTPLTPRHLNVDLARALDPTSLLLVAANRLGVLHDALSATRAAAAAGLALTAIVLSPAALSPSAVDASLTSNAAELQAFVATDVVDLPRAGVETLALGPELARLVDLVLCAP